METVSSPEPSWDHSRKVRILIAVGIVLAFGAYACYFNGSVGSGNPSGKEVPEQVTSMELTEVTKADDVENWKTYRNQGYGFEFKYPGDSMVVEDDSLKEILLWTKESYDAYQDGDMDMYPYLRITSHPLDGASLQEYVKTWNKGVTGEPWNVQGLDFIRIYDPRMGDGGTYDYYLAHETNDMVLEIKEMTTEKGAGFQDILSTFKFINEKIVHIDWLSQIEEKPVKDFFTQAQLDNFYTDCNYFEYGGGKEIPKPCYDLFSFYRAGSVSEGKYKGYDYYLVSRTFIAHGESDDYYRVLRDPSDGKLLLLPEYSREPAEEDRGFFTVVDDIYLDNLLPPAEIHIPDTDYYLEAHSESPNALFADMISVTYREKPRKLFTDAQAGDIYLDEYTQTFMVRVPDGSLMIYRLKLPFIKERRESNDFNIDDLLLDIRFADGKQNAGYYMHGSKFQFVCAGGQLYDIVPEELLKPDTQLVLAGTSPSGEKFYELNDRDILKRFYEGKGFEKPSKEYIYNMPYAVDGNMTFEEFLSHHPLLFWKDPLGRWIQFTNNIFSSTAECGGSMGKSAL